MIRIKDRKTVKIILALYFLFSLLFFTGCGLVSVFGTPGRGERKVEAEYNLAEDFKTQPGQKLLILVNQPISLNTKVNLRQSLTSVVTKNLSRHLSIDKYHLITYEQLVNFQSRKKDFHLLTPTQVGKKLKANKVLFIAVDDFEMEVLDQSDYLTAMLSARAKLYEVSTSEQLWPSDKNGKVLKVGFEYEKRGRNIALARLVADIAHCVTRYLYDCPKPKFKIPDDLSGKGWKNW